VRNETLSGMHSSCFVPHPDYDKGVFRYGQQQLPQVRFVLVLKKTSLAATGTSVSRTAQDQEDDVRLGLEPSQRKLSLSSRDDPNYKGIMPVAGAAPRYALMRSRATSPGASLPSGRCLLAVRACDTSVPRDSNSRWML
jgi:hypothetical protein